MTYLDSNAVGTDLSREVVEAYLRKQGLPATETAVTAVMEQIQEFFILQAKKESVLKEAVHMVGVDVLEALAVA